MLLSSSTTLQSSAASQWVKDVTQQTFMKDVIEPSEKTPVLVDFWAPWCGPCKQLTPLLEKLVNEQNGAVLLAKINADQNQALAQQLNIQSIPTVYIFHNRQPIDAFSGMIPEPQLRAMLGQLSQLSRGIPAMIDEALGLMNQNEFAQARTIFEHILQLEESCVRAKVGLARCLLADNNHADAQEIFDALPSQIADLTEANEIKALETALALAATKPDAAALAGAKAHAEKKPHDPQAQFDLALALFHGDQVKEAIDTLLILFKQHPGWQEDMAKKQLLIFFESLGFTHPMSEYGRKELSKVLFS